MVLARPGQSFEADQGGYQSFFGDTVHGMFSSYITAHMIISGLGRVTLMICLL